jgi:hypothetical protein
MGADMMFEYVDFPEGADLEEIKEKMFNKIDADFKDNADDYKEIVKGLFETLESRDVASFSRLGRDFYLTGGMSWWDNPTESYDHFEGFWALPEEITSISEEV